MALPEWANNNDAKNSRIFNSGLFAVSSSVIRFICSMTSALVLARLLTPEDFGIVGMVLPLLALVNVFSDGGVSQYTLQSKDVNNTQLTQTFWVGAFFCTLLFVVVAALSPLIANLYNENRLVLICLVLSLTLLLNAFTLQHNALVKRCFRQDLHAIAEISSACVSTATGIVVAFYGGAYWALVAIPLSKVITHAIIIWCLTGWVPRFITLDKAEVKKLLLFGWYISFTALIIGLGRNIDKVLIGINQGAVELGYYTLAYSLISVPLIQILGPIGGVAVPYLRQEHGQSESLILAIKRVVTLIGLSIVPAVLWAALLADELISLFLGDKWLLSVEIFWYLAMASIPMALYIPANWVLFANGQVNKNATWSVIALGPLLIAYFLGLQWGAVGVAKCYAVAQCCLLIICPLFASRYSKFDVKSYYFYVIKSISPAFISVFIVSFIGLSIELTLYEKLIYSFIMMLSLHTVITVLFFSRDKDIPIFKLSKLVIRR